MLTYDKDIANKMLAKQLKHLNPLAKAQPIQACKQSHDRATPDPVTLFFLHVLIDLRFMPQHLFTSFGTHVQSQSQRMATLSQAARSRAA